VLNRKWTSSILSTSSPTGSTRRISSKRGFLEYSSILFDHLNNYTTTFVVDMVRHEGLFNYIFVDMYSARGASFLVYLGNINIDLVDIDFRLRLRRLLHVVDRLRCWGSWPSEASPTSGQADDSRSAYGFGLARKPSRYGF
jgi:hypothetical protein